MLPIKFQSLGGRPTIFKEKANKNIGVRISESEDNIIDIYSNKMKISRTMFIRYLINMSSEMESHGLMVPVGEMAAIGSGQNLKAELKYTDAEFKRIELVAEATNLPTEIMIRNLSNVGSYVGLLLVKTKLIHLDDVTNSLMSKIKSGFGSLFKGNSEFKRIITAN